MEADKKRRIIEQTITIDPKTLYDALCQPTPYKILDIGSAFLSFHDVLPLTGYEAHNNFPNCCNFHKEVYEQTQGYINDFPNCCDEHRKLTENPLFDKSKYLSLPEKVVNQIAYTEHCIANEKNKPDWFESITEYINWNIESFGQPDIGSFHYVYYLKHTLNHNNETTLKLPEHKVKMLLDYLDGYLYICKR